MIQIPIWTNDGHPPQWLQALYEETNVARDDVCAEKFSVFGCTRSAAPHDVHFAGIGDQSFELAWVGGES